MWKSQSRLSYNALSMTLAKIKHYVNSRFPHSWLFDFIWIIAGLGIYWLSLLKNLPVLSWVLLAIVFTPIIHRLVCYGYRSCKTPFDLPIVFLTIGMIMGVVISPDQGMSVIALQSYLVIIAFYYTSVHHPHPLTYWGIVIGIFSAGILAMVFAGWAIVPGVEIVADQQFNNGAMYGPATMLMVVSLILGGVALYHRKPSLQIIMGVLFGALITLALWETRVGVSSFFAGDTVSGRIPLWQAAIEMIKAHPITGIGLGAWPLVFHSGTLAYPTHPHSAYLELYCNTGILGVIALVLGVIISIRLGWRILQAENRETWYGLGIGIILALLATALLGLIEQWPSGITLLGTDRYHYIVILIPLLLAAPLTIVERKLTHYSCSTFNQI